MSLKQKIDGCRCNIVNSVIMLSIFLMVWHFSSLYFNSIFFPPPERVFLSLLVLLTDGKNYGHIFVTTLRVIESTVALIVIGTGIVLIAKKSKYADHVISGMLYPFLQAMPTIAWAFLVLVWFGLSEISPLFIVVLSVLPTFFVPLYEGFKDISRDIIEMGQSFTKSRARLFAKIYFPLLYPYFFSGVRLSFAKSFKIMVVAEFFVSTSGLGYMLGIAKDSYNVGRILAWTFIIIMIIMFFDYVLFNYLERKTIGKWKLE